MSDSESRCTASKEPAAGETCCCGKCVTASKKGGRRHHRKSRLGCKTCKRRKVKCDEAKPECGNCQRFGVACDFLPTAIFKAQTKHTEEPQVHEGRRRGRPRSDWSSWAEQVHSGSPSAQSPEVGSGITSQTPPSTQPSEFSNSLPNLLDVENIELFHSFMVYTAPTLGDNFKFYRDKAPVLGFRHPCVLNGMLALAALHQVRLQPEDAIRFVALADRHSTIALQQATDLLPFISLENGQALYMVTVMICFTAFARGPSPGNLLVVAENGEVPWVSLISGVRFVVKTLGWPAILTGVLAQEPEPEAADMATQHQVPALPSFVEWEKSMDEVSSLVSILADSKDRDVYQHDIKLLSNAFQTTFGTINEPKSFIKGEVQHVLSWLYQIETGFVERLERKEPIALILLGHFAVLLRTLDRYWFMNGWGVHILSEVRQASEAVHKWLAWPTAVIQVSFV
ncbi:C6 zinc finger protein [Verticillium dahliae VdLs.17]|uniref:C6 zinc finger protein n=2 Tax=Verticillium dahliae TaxID=27337 RepID=G2XDJ9_VERDV|nr:C6 zinc finger protein [Verticillium dahliae VdLs.17]EGY17067.1 C6 zinc finger protein [Verticillium dahliae VdLs.17]KAF3347734.1 3-oxoacyl-[acyl-carrier-protein] reductase [Verticillium dahliae VDG2]KAH6696054.1 C6 zinc finger protein [Verticillium dahliae]